MHQRIADSPQAKGYKRDIVFSVILFAEFLRTIHSPWRNEHRVSGGDTFPARTYLEEDLLIKFSEENEQFSNRQLQHTFRLLMAPLAAQGDNDAQLARKARS
ncbi:MAG: hypothetical protein ACREVK_05040 [Gammaproteobacteria bacterium]